jgi:Protein of unknown function (DUF2937)
MRASVFAVLSLFPAALFSQAPEFMQQYAQRLAGAADELQLIVRHFDDDSRRSGYDQPAALELMARNPEQLVRDQSVRMKETISRLGRLREQQSAMSQASTITRFLSFVSNYDRPLAMRTWEAYQPALPLSFDGALFALIGFTSSFLLLCAGAAGLRKLARA